MSEVKLFLYDDEETGFKLLNTETGELYCPIKRMDEVEIEMLSSDEAKVHFSILFKKTDGE